MLKDKDIFEIRKDFPILSQTMNGKPLVYLDSAATTQKPWSVIESLKEYYTTYNANVHRGFYALSERATFTLNEVRHKIARFIKAQDPHEIIFTSGATESSNLLVRGLAHTLNQCDHVLLGQLEHNSQAAPWLHLANERNLTVDLLPFTTEGLFDLTAFKQLLKPTTRVIAITYASNFLGTIQPIAAMVRLARRINPNVTIVLDAVQAIPYLPIDVQSLDVDFLFFSGHKMLAPMGIGVLWGKKDKLETLSPLKMGGGSLEQIQGRKLILKDLPERLEAGTPNVEGVVGFGAAIDYLESIGMDQIQDYEERLAFYLRDALRSLPSFQWAVKEGAPSLAMATGHFLSLNSHDVVAYLDAKGVAVRSGTLCSYLIAQTLNYPSMIRASFYLYNTTEEVDFFVKALSETERTLRC